MRPTASRSISLAPCRSLNLGQASSFVDASHVAYYAPSSRRAAQTTRCAAAKPGGRKSRVRRQSAQVAEVLERLETTGDQLASYDLRLPSSNYASIASSSSSESSDSEDEPSSQASYIFTPAAAAAPRVATVSVCQGKACKKKGSDAVLASLRHSEESLGGNLEVHGCKCLGFCKRGIAVHIEMASGESATYVNVDSPSSLTQIAVAMLQ